MKSTTRASIIAAILVLIALSVLIMAWQAGDFLKDSPSEPSLISVDAKDAGLPPSDTEPIDVSQLVIDGGSVSLVSGGQVLTAGQDHMPAWSTMKVPIAIAALRNNPEVQDLVAPAIEWSSNDAAAELWDSMGLQEEAGAQVEQLLNELEISAEFPAATTHFGYDAFGAVDWPLSEQVRFSMHIGCLPEAASVTESMGNIAEEHSWGLGRIDGALFKGGWGSDDETGVFQSRQFGLLPVEGGYAPVAIAATAQDGSEETAQAMLDELANNIDRVRPQLKPVACMG